MHNLRAMVEKAQLEESKPTVSQSMEQPDAPAAPRQLPPELLTPDRVHGGIQ
jgi:hypothetical protein